MKKKDGLLLLISVVWFIGLILLPVACNEGFIQETKVEDLFTSDDDSSVDVKRTFTQSEKFSLGFTKDLYGVSFSGNVKLNSEESSARLILVDSEFNEKLMYETYYLLDGVNTIQVKQAAEETEYLQGIQAKYIRIELVDAEVQLETLHYSVAPKLKSRELKQHGLNKATKINRNQNSWIAGETEVSKLTYAERQALFGGSTFPDGIEFYKGGIMPSAKGGKVDTKGKDNNKGKGNKKDRTPKPEPSPEPSPDPGGTYVAEWDWRNRHGVNWVTSVKSQGSCGSCWAFSTTATIEVLVNLYYNQKIDLDLSEQQMLSCSGAGTCSGGFPSTVFDYVQKNYIVNDAAFPYVGKDVACVLGTVTERISLTGRVNYSGVGVFDKLKGGLIKYGPINGGLRDWNHTMLLVGWKTVNNAPVWTFKNSWGSSWGDKGYAYVSTTEGNIAWTHAVYGVYSKDGKYQVVAEDKDGDGYYWWGLGPKPTGLNAPDQPDGDDNDPTKGPIDAYGNFIN